MRVLLRSLFALSISLGLASAALAAQPATIAPEIRGFVAKHCLMCHGAENPKAGLSLHAETEERHLLKGRKKWDLVVDMIEAGEMPPKDKPQPSADETDAFVKTLRDTYARLEANTPPDPGRVTVRRLNRTEYNNTIRDLTGLDLRPADDFPSDDVGHGFDNIGDVLSLSPVLMERYLAAAEMVSQKMILVDPPKPPQRWQSGQYLEPAGRGVADRKHRLLDPSSSEAIHSGPLHTPYRIQEGNKYVFRVRVSIEGESEGPVKVAILAVGKDVPNPASDELAETLLGAAVKGLRPFAILSTVEVTSKKRKEPQIIEVKLDDPRGIERMALAAIKPAEEQKPAMLLVENFQMEGPLDTRPLIQQREFHFVDDRHPAEQAREMLSRFATRAYRRPVTPVELDRLMRIAEQPPAEGGKWEAGVQLAVQAILASPKFLFRFELDQRPDSQEPHPIEEHQLASRLSYFLWSSMPDEELRALAAKGELTANIESQVRRMLKDPKAEALVENFALQWLQLKRIQTAQPDLKLFPNFRDNMRRAMLEETKLFFAEIVREDRSLLDLIGADYTYLNEQLARHYGIADTQGNWIGQKQEREGGQPIKGREFVRVSLQGETRGGLLTQASVLTVTSNPTRTSPVKRGRWILEQILGTPPPPAPPDVPELESQKDALTGTLRQRMEQHRANPSCANCHARMDPLGFAFENYDAIGAFRKKDGDADIDPSGVLPDGKAFQGAGELKAILKEKKELFVRNVAEKMLIYALGRGLEYYDKRPVDQIVTNVNADDQRFSRLVIEIVKSDPFRMRRGSQHIAE